MLGDMFELGEHSEKEHEALISFVANLGFTNVYFCGEAFQKAFAVSDFQQFSVFETRTALETYLSPKNITDSAILIKGSRGMAMEKLVRYL
jgi:UDP-N-acetylmuramoyl-tripeptide--D-alanyl-D-alanine ligase